MYKRYLISIFTFVLLLVPNVYAALDFNELGYDFGVDVKSFKQFKGGWENDLMNNISGKTIGAQGCLITNMTNILYYHGMKWIPDSNHYPDLDKPINPRTFNKWLRDTDGYDGASMLPGAVKKFYYKFPYFPWYLTLKPNDDCWPFQKEFNGRYNFDCFRRDTFDDKAETFLNNDLFYEHSAEVLNIKGYYEKPDKDNPGQIKLVKYKSHFVVASGYSPSYSSYRVEDPGRTYDAEVTGIPLAKLYPKLQQPENQTTQATEFGDGPAYKLLGLRRYAAVYSAWEPDLRILGATIHSPVEIQMLDPMGRITGYDPVSGNILKDNPNGIYYTETISSINSEDQPEEPVKSLYIKEPTAGNYILKIFGTGDGAYTINIYGKKEDGTSNLDTALTGTAYPGLQQTYRIQYFPTGESSISSENQPPIAETGSDQTVEQSYEVTLQGENSHDPDGDPLKYGWSFVSKPDGSTASLSSTNATNPSFTPDKAGTYILQLVINDGFADSVPDTVIVTVTPIQSHIAVTPNFSTLLNQGTGAILFDLNNTGRIGVFSGTINISLKDPDGVTIYSGTQTFSMAVGENKTVSVLATIPSLKFGNYTLTYTQSDETKTGSPTTVNIPNSALVAFFFDKLTYRARETANLTLNLTETGKFDLDTVSVSVSVPDAGYTGTATANIGQTQPLQYAVQIPATITPGQHYANVTLTLPSGSSVVQSGRFAAQESALVIGYLGQTTFNAGGTINLTVENTGSVDTSYTTEKLVIKSSMGEIIYDGSATGTVMAGEKKTLADITIPAQAASGIVFLNVVLKDSKTGKSVYLSKSLNISGLEMSLFTMTDKEAYLNTEAVTAVTTLATASLPIEEGELDIKISRYSKPSGGEFLHFLPKSGWMAIYNPLNMSVAPDGIMYVVERSIIKKVDKNGKFILQWDTGVSDPWGIAVGPDGYIYVAYAQNFIKKFDSNGNLITKWGSYGTSNGQFNNPYGLSVSPGGSVYVVDKGNNRIQMFDGNGNFIAKWGSYGTGDGQFYSPTGIAVGPDGSVYVTDRLNNRIQMFDSSGSFIKKWGNYGSNDGQFNSPYGIAVSPDGYVYVADKESYRIQKFDSSGNFISKWGNQGSKIGQFNKPSGIAVSSDGSVFIVESDPAFLYGNNRIQKFDSNGNFVDSWRNYCNNDLNFDRVPDQNQQCDGEFWNPRGSAIGPDGSIYVMEGFWSPRIQKFDGNGNFLTKWGSYGAGNGQFNNPASSGIAVGGDGFLYVADSHNHRIQKFDSNGNFIAKWGSYGSGEGQFSYPNDVAVAPDGSVYVADSGNNRVQKFDRDGNFISQLWADGINGQSIAVAPDGSVYVKYATSYWRNTYCIRKYSSSGEIVSSCFGEGVNFTDFAVAPDGSVIIMDGFGSTKKFNSNGQFISKLGEGGWGYEDGQFNAPQSIAIGSDGSIYVADTDNNRIQKMPVFSLGASETVFETTLPINQPSSMSQEYITNVGNLNVTGKLYLQAILKNKMGQVLAASEYPFYIADGNTVFLFKTDKKIYKPGETITFTGEIRNLADAEATNLKAEIKSRASDGAAQTVYTETFSIPAGGAHQFTFTATAGNEGPVALIGTVSQNDLPLVEIVDGYEVATPKVAVSVSSPDVVGKNPFDLNVEVKNTGKVEFTGRLLLMRDWWNTIDDRQITIPAGETKLLQYSQQIAQTTAYTVDISGDVTQTSEKTVIFGEAAAITIGSQSIEKKCTEVYRPVFDRSTGKVIMVKELICEEITSAVNNYPEGKVGIPVTITNTGQVDEQLEITFQLSGQGSVNSGQTKTHYLPKGGSITDTLYYDLTSGSYQLTAVSSQPYAFAQTSFTVLKENDVTMTNTVGSQGTDGQIPVTVNLTNNGYNDINGSINLTAINTEGKAVWRGEAQVSGLKPQSSMSYPVNIDSAGIISGAYKTDIVLYSTSGKQLTVNQAQVRVAGPIFEITSIPVYSTFTVGKQAAFSFTIKNSGTVAGTTNFSVKAMDVLNQSVTDLLNPGEEKSHTFNFTVPEDAEDKDYDAEYTLTPVLSQGEKGQAKFHIAGVNIGATATLDKTAYKNGDTALLTLTVSKQSQFDDGTYVAIIRYGAHHDMKTFTLTSQPLTLTFSVPLAEITGENLFYSIHFESGRTIYMNSLSLNRAQPDLVVSSIAPGSGTMRTQKIEVGVTNVGDLPSEATTLKLYDGEPYSGGIPITTLAVSALAKDESATITYDWDIFGKAGKRTVYAVVDPDNTIIERMEANNTGSVDITVPDVAMEVSTTKTKYEANEDVGIAETVVNLTSGTTYTDAILTTTVKDPAGTMITTLTNNIPVLAPGEASYANSWNTASSRPGGYSINAVVSGQGSGVSETPLATATTAVEILPTVSAYGDMTSPDEVIQGFPLDISYSITNNGNIDIPQAEVKVEVEDKTRGGKTTLAEAALDYIAVLSANAGSIAVEKVDVEPGEYTISLILTAGDKAITISSKDITVKPPLKVTKGISTLPRVLVWVPLPHPNPLPEGEGVNEKIATDALTKLGAYYKVVHTEAEFIEGMRSGYYNTYALLNTNKPTTDGLTSELMESVYGGDTLIFAGNSNMDDIKVSEVTGTKFTGYMADGTRTTTAGFPLYEQSMNITTAGKIQKVTVTSDKALIWGTVQDYPSIVVNSYGKGKGVLITFDLGISAEAVADTSTYSALLGRVIWNTAPVEVKLTPEGVVPVEISIQSLGSAFDLKIVEKADNRLTLLDTTLNGVTDRVNNTVTWDAHLNGDQTMRPVYLAALPQYMGSYNTEADVYYLNKGEYKLYNSYPLNIELSEGTAELQGNILNALSILAVTKDQQGIKDSIVKSYLALISRSSWTRKEIDKDIHDLLKITEDLKKLNADTIEVRAGLNKLLIVFQRRWVIAR